MAQQFTYNQLLTIFKNFADNHDQVKSFYAGKPQDFRNPDRLYPLLYVQCNDVESLANEIQYQFEIVVLDRITTDGELSNENEVFSDTLQIISDLKAYLTNSFVYDFIVVPDASISKVGKEINSDITSGWLTNLTIRTPWSADICSIPGIIPSIAFANGNVASASQNYLTCENITGCSTFVDYVASHSSSGGTVSDPLNINQLNAHLVNSDIVNATEINNEGTSNLSIIFSDEISTGLIEASNANIDTANLGTLNVSDTINIGNGEITMNAGGVISCDEIDANTFIVGGLITMDDTGIISAHGLEIGNDGISTTGAVYIQDDLTAGFIASPLIASAITGNNYLNIENIFSLTGHSHSQYATISGSALSLSAGSTGNLTVQRSGNTITYDLADHIETGYVETETLNVTSEAFFNSLEGNSFYAYDNMFSGSSITNLENIFQLRSHFRASAVTSAMFAGTIKKATVTFSSSLGATNYAVSVTGDEPKSWSIESKSATGFVINSNSSSAPSGNTYWTANIYS